MEDIDGYIQSANINEKWLNNIYENIKNLENYERLIREGCKSLLDFMNIPFKSRPVVIGDTQFKNLKLIITEFKLLLGDLTPILEEEDEKEFFKVLDNIDKALKCRKLFVKDYYDVDNRLTQVDPTPFFYETIDILHKTKKELFKKIKNILYINTNNG